MSSWSQRRRLTYISIIVVLLLGVIGLPSFFYFYRAPTCSDGIKNGSETGVDCGGSCQRLCASSFLPPAVAWTGMTQVSDGLYNVAAYIINPNPTVAASRIPYHAVLFDKDGSAITEYDGTVSLPPHRNTLAFQAAVSTGKRVAVRAFFQFTGSPDWRTEVDPLSDVQVAGKSYEESAAGSSLTVTLKNNAPLPLPRITVYVVLYDADHNELAFSKTVVDSIDAGGIAAAPFTWPTSWKGKVVSIEVMPVAE